MTGPVVDEGTLLGRWRIAVGSDLPGREHALEIVFVDADSACGYATIDARGRDDAPHGSGGGAQAEEPDRRRHEVAFRATRKNGGIAFVVVAGAVMPRRYAFELYVVGDELCGVVDVKWDREGAVARRDGVRGVRATPAAARAG